jgi:hypothetical protein
MEYGSIQIDHEGCWLVHMRGAKGKNPFDALRELIEANKNESQMMVNAAVHGSD